MAIVDLICGVLMEVLSALSGALPQFDSVWSELGSALEDFCAQFGTQPE